MDAQKLERILQILLYVSLGFCAAYWLLHFIVLEYKNWKNGQAPVNTCGAIAYIKHSETALVNQGRTSGDVHFITFHTDSGEIVKLYMNARQFYSIPEGSRGMLTWQGERFWKFEKEE